MEKRIAKKVENYVVDMKTAIKDYIKMNNLCLVKNTQLHNNVDVIPDNVDVLAEEIIKMQINSHVDHTSEFIKFVYDYDSVEFVKEDFQKRKRVKNIVPYCERCMAKRASGEQCTRRKSGTNDFCGTHAKGTPHGIISPDSDKSKYNKKIEVWVEEICGINYYIDNDGNVYKHDDVLNNKMNPDIIAKWQKTIEGEYTIPAFNI
tara:strand:- start:44 stop:655 length:612 start_codon:yes stop_codon:yes gene_type:complete